MFSEDVETRGRKRRKKRHRKLSKRVETLLYNLGWFALAVAFGVPILALALHLTGRF